MFLLEIDESNADFVEKELEGSNLEIDPRPIIPPYRDELITFEITYKHNTSRTTVAIITKIDHLDEDGWCFTLYFRVYDPAKEIVPSFNTTTYNYLGIENERAPRDTAKGIIDKSAKMIRRYAFYNCKVMKVCEMHDDVEAIQHEAFTNCSALEAIKLSTKFKLIGYDAFRWCESLDAIFLPCSLDKIEEEAFFGCNRMKIVSFPPSFSAEQIGKTAFYRCDRLFHRTQTVEYGDYDHKLGHDNSVEVHQSLLNFIFFTQPPLHLECLRTDITAEDIHHCLHSHKLPAAASAIIADHNGMTPLHILARNPHANAGLLLTCLELNMNAAFMRDVDENDDDDNNNDDDGSNNNAEFGMTVMGHLWKYAKKAAFARYGGDNYDDSDNVDSNNIMGNDGAERGMTAMDYLWRHGNVNRLICLVQVLCLHRETQ